MNRMVKIAIVLSLVYILTPTLSIAGDAPTGYVIGVGDVLEISVWDNKELRRTVVVPPDHMISFPLLGSVDIRGMTVPMVRETLTKKIREYVSDASVTVILTKINSMVAYVNGKVNKPGAFPISADTNVMQLLAMAGGLTPFASASDIIIIRSVGGHSVKIPFNYNEVKRGKKLKQNIILKRGDVVVVR